MAVKFAEGEIGVLADTSKFAPQVRVETERVQRNIQALIDTLPETTTYRKQLEAAVKAAAARVEAEIGTKVDIRSLMREVDRAVAVAEAQADEIEIEVKVDSDRVTRAIAAINHGLDRMRDRVSISGDEFRLLGRTIASFSRVLQLVGTIAATLALPAAASAILALAAAAAQAAAELTPLVGVLAALPQAAAGITQAFGTVGLALIGVGKGFKALQKAADDQGQTATRSASQQASAQKAVENAHRRVREALKGVQDAHRRVEDAARAVEDAQRRVADSIRRVEDAQRNLQRATRDLARAQEALTEAFREAREELEDARLAAEGASLAEERAALRLERARQRQAEVNNDTTATEYERRDAALDVAEAEHDARVASERRADEQERLNRLEEQGVENSEQVVEARERIQAQEEQLADAHRDVADAQRDVADAQRGVVDAQRDLAEAQEGVADAQERVADAQADVAAALQALADKSDLASGKVNKLTQDFDKLSPAAQRFVKFIFDELRPQFNELRAIAAEGLFPGVEDSLRRLSGTFFPLLKDVVGDTARVLGNLARKGADLLTSGPFTDDFKKITKSNTKVLEILGDAGLNFVDVIRNIAAAAIPLVERLAGIVLRLSEMAKKFFEAKRASGELQEFFRRTGDTIEKIIAIIKNITIAWFNFQKTVPGQPMLDGLVNLTNKMREFTSSTEGQTKIQEFMEKLQPIFDETAGAIGDIGKAFGRIALEAAPGLTDIIRAIREFLIPAFESFFTQLAGPGSDAVRRLIEGVSRLITAFGEAGGGLMTAFLSTLGLIFRVVGDLLARFPVLGDAVKAFAIVLGALKGAQLAANILAFGHLKDAIDGVSKALLFAKAHPIVAAAIALAALAAGIDQVANDGKGLAKVFEFLDRTASALVGIFVDLGNAVLKAVRFFANLADKIPGVDIDTRGLNDAIVTTQQSYDMLQREGLTKVWGKLTQADEATKKASESQRKLKDDTKAMADQIVSSMPGVNAVFDQFGNDVPIDLDKVSKAFEKQIEDEQAFFTNVTKIATDGGLELAKKIADLGPTRGAALAKQIAGSDPAHITALSQQVQRLSTLERTNADALAGVFVKGRTDGITNRTPELVGGGEFAAQKTHDGYSGWGRRNFKTTGEDGVRRVVEGVTSAGSGRSSEAGGEHTANVMGNKFIDTVVRRANEVGSAFVNSVARGVVDRRNEPAISNAISHLIDLFIRILLKKMGFGSPSKIAMDIGSRFVDSLALGMTENTPAIAAAAKEIGRATEKSFAPLRLTPAAIASAIGPGDTKIQQNHLDIHPGAIQIKAEFGPGSTADDVIDAMTNVARIEFAKGLKEVVDRSLSGVQPL